MTTSKLNGPRGQRFVDCPRNFLDVIGAKVEMGGIEMRLNKRRIELLEPFVTEQRDEHFNRCRSSGNLTEEQRADLESFGFTFEPNPQWPNAYYSTKKFEIGSFYRQIWA